MSNRIAFAALVALLTSLSLPASAQVWVVEARVAPAPAPAPTVAPAPSTVMVVAPAPSSYAPTYAPVLDTAPRTRPVWRAVGIGAGMLGASWALNVVGSGLWMLAPSSWNRDGEFFYWSLVPLVGPWAQMGSMTDPSWQTPLLALDGLVQLAGFVTAIVGQCAHETVEPRATEGSLAVVPLLSPQMIGLAATGTF